MQPTRKSPRRQAQQHENAQKQSSKGVTKAPRRLARDRRTPRQLMCNPLAKGEQRKAVKLCISFDHSPGDVRDKSVWSIVSLQFPPTEPIETLPALVKTLVEQKVRKDASLSKQLRANDQTIVISTAIALPDSARNEFVSLNTRPRIELFSDLFLDPQAPELPVVNVLVILTLQSGSQPSRSLDAKVLTPDWVEPIKDHRILRIGFVTVQNDEKDAWVEKRCDPRSIGVGYMQALMVKIHRTSGTLQFWRTHAYDFEDYCIGNVADDASFSRLAFSNKYTFLGRLSSVQHKRESRARFKERLKELLADDDEEAQMGSGVPILPSYCYNKFTPEELGLGLHKWPRRNIDVAATFVNRYLQASQSKPLRFPVDTRILVEESNEIGDVIQVLQQEMDFRGREDGIYINSAKLFQPAHHDKWQMELWVLPQTKARKMYRYVAGKLDQFLSPSITVRTTDKRLYLEAHIVPKE